MWLLVNCKNGISSYEVSRDLGVSQKSAWHMMHRIRLGHAGRSLPAGSSPGKSRSMKPSSAEKRAICTRTTSARKDHRGGRARARQSCSGILERETEGAPKKVRVNVIPDRKKTVMQAERARITSKLARRFHRTTRNYLRWTDEYSHRHREPRGSLCQRERCTPTGWKTSGVS